MIKKTHEIVITFREGDSIIGMLVQNGKTEFYRTSHANGEFVANLLEVDEVEDKKDKK